MGERGGGGGDSDSDETIVEGSVAESDVEEEEFRRRWWLPFLNKDMTLTAEIGINEGAPSPEICFIQKFYDRTCSQKEEQINPVGSLLAILHAAPSPPVALQVLAKVVVLIVLIPQEAHASDQSQSLLQSWIKCPSLTENISKPGFSLNAAIEGQQNNSVDIKLNGFWKDSEEKISPKLSNEDLFPEISHCLDAVLEDAVMVPKEQTPKEIFPHVLEDCQRTCMTIIGTDNRVKEHSPDNDTDLSLMSPGKIFMEAFTEQSRETGEIEISDLLGSLSDSESFTIINPLPEKLQCQGHAFSIDSSADESSDALPVELVTALNALSGSVVQPITPVTPNERQLNTDGEQLNSEPSIPQLDDDCTQITNMIEPQLATIQVEEIKTLIGSNLQRTTNEQPVGDQQREKEVISDYWGATSSEKKSEEGSSHSVEAVACAETAQTTSRKVIQLRETFSRKCRDHVSSHHQILEETPQRMSHSGSTTRSKAKDLRSLVSKMQTSTSKDKQDLETNIHQEITLNEDREAKQRRRSKRIENKLRQEAFGRNSVNRVCPISLSTINRRNIYGETILHRAVAHQDVDLVRNIIKAGGNVNVQDYAGWTALHTASVEGFYGIANELLKARADVNARGIEQITPLQDAVKEGHYEMAELLLWYGADPLLKNEMGRCALEEASDPSMRKLLKSYVAKSRRDSVSGGDDLKKMLNAQSVEDTTMYKVSLQTDESEPVCTNPQETSQKAALYSSISKTKLSSNQSQFSQALEQQTSKKSESSLFTRKEAVILHGSCNTTAGRKTKKKRNAKGETQLHIAARRGDLSLVKTLISSGICVNEQDYAGWTAIHEASNMGFTEVILELLKAGANVNSRSLDGVLPIHDAVSGNYLEAVRILLQHGANPCERDGSGKSAFDEAYDDEMKELLKPYTAMDAVHPVEATEVTGRRSKRCCYDSCKNDDAALEPQHEKYSVESVAAIQDAEEKQKELLLLELRTSKDADVYIQRLSQMQETLNEMLAKQKTERDTLLKKYRASVESFKKGALRKQLVNLASRQKSLLTVAQNQQELVQKIQNYRKTKQVFSASCSEKQISSLVISCGSNKRQSLTADEIMCPDVVTLSMGLDASMPSGNRRVEAHLSLENRFSAQECSQHPHICLAETGANREAIRSKEASVHALASENREREDPFDNMSKLTNAVEVVTLPSEPALSTAKTKCLQQKDIDFVATAEQGSKSLNPTSVTSALNVVEPRSTVVNKKVCQPGSDCQQVLTDEDLHRYINKKEAFQQQQQQVTLSTSAKNFPNTQQQMIFQSSENLLNANLMLTNLTSNTDYLVNLSEKSSQSYGNQECEQKQGRYGRKNRKKLQLIDLLELGRIKPGENVLEFKLQEFTHKATLLNNGKIRTSKRQILQNPIQWVKDLLGSDISVTWKYVWNKVTYLGTQLSKFLVEELPVSSDLELPSQEREPSGSSVQFNSVESLMHFLQFCEIVMIHKEEFLPCPAMEEHWSFYKRCEDFGF
ncbi:LOW QUALITY PROTEIN: ankyrin repeat domain-containing protein 31 [Cariama cristata]